MKWIMAVIVVAFLLSTFLMYEGRGTRRTPGLNPDGSMADYEVAKINGRSLMRSELEQRLRNYLSQYSTRSIASVDMAAIYRSVLDQAILESQLAKEVEEKGIRVSDAEADMAMKSYADTYFPTREAFYQVLANSGIKVDDYKRSIARQIASDRLIRNEIGDITVSDDKVAEFYETMKTILYSQPEGFTVHMADFATSADAEYFREKIAAGESWDVLASGDSLASKDVINITKLPVRLPASTFKTGLLSVLDSLDVGQVSPVFAVSSNDYGVAMKVEHVDAGNTPYNEVSGDIRMLLTQQEERMKLTAYQEALRKKADVVINDTELFTSPVVSGDNQSGDILPILTLEEASDDEPADDKPAETPAVVSDEKPAETPKPIAEEKTEETHAVVSDEKTVETPVTVSDEKHVETPVTVSDEKPVETPVTVSDEKPEETPAVVSDEKPEETPAPVSEEKTEETPEPVVSEDKTAETPEPVAASEDTFSRPAVTAIETTPEVSQDISADKR